MNDVSFNPFNPAFRTRDNSNPEFVWGPLYDTVQYPASGVAQLSFFTTPKGQTATLIRAGASSSIIKSYVHTNIEQPGISPNTVRTIIGMVLTYKHLTPGNVQNPIDRDRIRDHGVIEFKTEAKDLFHLRLLEIPEANPFVIGSVGSGESTTMIGTAGGGGYGVSMYRFPVPFMLEANQGFTFHIDIDGSVAVNRAVDIGVSFQAYAKRPT